MEVDEGASMEVDKGGDQEDNIISSQDETPEDIEEKKLEPMVVESIFSKHK